MLITANRLTTLTDDASQNFTYGYDIADRLISNVLPNGITSTFEYDGMSRLKKLKHQSASATLTENDFTYNAANQIGQIAELAQTKNFGYDNIDRLTGMTNGTANESYAFDAVGNRTASHRSATYTHHPFNKLTATANASFSYDANGSMIGKTTGTVSWSFVWDDENRLILASDGTDTVEYSFDALGRRVRRTQGATVEKYTFAGLDVIQDDSNGTLTKYQNGPGIDNKLSLKTGSDVKYFLQDHLGSTIALTDTTGSITASQTYDSFGNGTDTNFPTRYQFTGREFDSFTGLQYNRARHYDPKVGRFVSEDPIGFGGGDINLYGYVYNRPNTFRDPTGNIPVVPLIYGGIIIGGLIIASSSPVNAPGPNSPIYFPDNPLILNAAGGPVLGSACKVVGRFASPLISRLLAGGKHRIWDTHLWGRRDISDSQRRYMGVVHRRWDY